MMPIYRKTSYRSDIDTIICRSAKNQKTHIYLVPGVYGMEMSVSSLCLARLGRVGGARTVTMSEQLSERASDTTQSRET